MQLFARIANQLREPCFDVHVHVFTRNRPGEIACGDFRSNGAEPVLDRRQLLLGEHPDMGQHLGVGEGPADVLLGQALVELHRGGKALYEGIGRFLEAAAP